MPELCYTMAMATITFEVPDELAKQLEDVGDGLSGLLAYALELAGLPRRINPYDSSQQSPWNEVFAFLGGEPTVDEILEFKISDEAQERLEELLEINREGALSHQENDELDAFIEVDHMFIMLKAYLRQHHSIA